MSNAIYVRAVLNRNVTKQAGLIPIDCRERQNFQCEVLADIKSGLAKLAQIACSKVRSYFMSARQLRRGVVKPSSVLSFAMQFFFEPSLDIQFSKDFQAAPIPRRSMQYDFSILQSDLP